MSSLPAEKKAEKSYLSSAVDSMNPWAGSRSSTPTPRTPKEPPANPLQPTNPGDHSISSVYGRSFKRYPPDCPPLKVQWFHAVDAPKRKPEWIKGKKAPRDAKPLPLPKKYVAFSTEDNRSIETAYQKVLEGLEEERSTGTVRRTLSGSRRKQTVGSADVPNTSLEQTEKEDGKTTEGVRVPVNEDFLFDVDIEERELAPAYWLGPVYDVRRGSWFYQEGSTLRPCEENLAAQLEEGYLKAKPWSSPARPRSDSLARTTTPKASAENLKAGATSQADSGGKPNLPTAQSQPQTHRLFGTYMNQIATYHDASTAWLSSESVYSWVTSTMYERFSGGGYMSGVKLVRGYSDAPKTKEEKRPMTPTGTSSTTEPEEKEKRVLKRRSAPPSTRSESKEDAPGKAKEPHSFKSRGNALQRQLSSLIESAETRDPEQEEEAIRKREEEEIQDDYTGQVGETQGRDIEHVVLVTHGIGQLLGIRMDSVNFVHDVNVLRKTLKSVYSTSADLKALNFESGDGPGNCRIQVLPVCWRHLLDFPKRREEKKREQDLTETHREEEEYPSLEDITIEGVAFARSLIADLALDVLLYQSAYREQISGIVLQESNRIYKLFLERNPGFKGKVHIMGHSLGSAIMFDILCRQKETPKGNEPVRNPLRFWPSQDSVMETPRDPRELKFDFNVDDFYCLGSPVGLFQMLKGRTIAARRFPAALPAESPLSAEYMEDPFLSAPIASSDQRVSPITGLPFSISSPKVAQLFNIFHPSDPISYRLEPLISPAMSSLKPQSLPYTKKGIFDSVAPQGLTGIGAMVGQSVSGLWSNLSAGIATNLLNRSLGLTQEDMANFSASQQQQQQQHAGASTRSPGAGTNIAGSGVIADRGELTETRKRQLADAAYLPPGTADGGAGRPRASTSGNDVTLLDDELETLYSRFQKKRADISGKEERDVLRDTWAEEEAKAQRMRREEVKVRALNLNGRVDYSIQEGALDFNPINTIASHMAYWADEDVSHFVMSQMLANKKKQDKK